MAKLVRKSSPKKKSAAKKKATPKRAKKSRCKCIKKNGERCGNAANADGKCTHHLKAPNSCYRTKADAKIARTSPKKAESMMASLLSPIVNLVSPIATPGFLPTSTTSPSPFPVLRGFPKTRGLNLNYKPNYVQITPNMARRAKNLEQSSNILATAVKIPLSLLAAARTPLPPESPEELAWDSALAREPNTPKENLAFARAVRTPLPPESPEELALARAVRTPLPKESQEDLAFARAVRTPLPEDDEEEKQYLLQQARIPLPGMNDDGQDSPMVKRQLNFSSPGGPFKRSSNKAPYNYAGAFSPLAMAVLKQPITAKAPQAPSLLSIPQDAITAVENTLTNVSSAVVSLANTGLKTVLSTSNVERPQYMTLLDLSASKGESPK